MTLRPTPSKDGHARATIQVRHRVDRSSVVYAVAAYVDDVERIPALGKAEIETLVRDLFEYGGSDSNGWRDLDADEQDRLVVADERVRQLWPAWD